MADIPRRRTTLRCAEGVEADPESVEQLVTLLVAVHCHPGISLMDDLDGTGVCQHVGNRSLSIRLGYPAFDLMFDEGRDEQHERESLPKAAVLERR